MPLLREGQSSGGSHVSVEIDVTPWAQELRERHEHLTSRLGGGSSTPCPITIGMVEHLTRNVDPQEYDPHHVSIGPYHRTKHPRLAREDEKLLCFHAVRSAATRDDVTEEVLLKEVWLLEDRARSCYADPIQMETKEFVHMLLLDACYVLARFTDIVGDDEGTTVAVANGQVEGECHTSSAALASAPAVPTAGGDDSDSLQDVKVVRDVLYLAENQIPFFVVAKVHELITGGSGTCAVGTFLGYVGDLLKKQQYSMATPEVTALSDSDVGNLLHLLHMHLKPTGDGDGPKTIGGGQRVGRWRSATDYHYAGVRFKSRPVGADAAQCILDVKLDSGGGTLLVPRLTLDARTLGLLRNLMGMEQRNPAKGGMHGKDVEFLWRRGIIVHSLGNHAEVADYFTNLCKGIVFKLDDPSRNYLLATCEALEKRSRSHPRRWMAWLRRKYFSNPWLTTGLAVAAVVLFCTVVQAVYSFLSYKQGANQKH
ncbi:unnamed protein product [Miscanthus lutarioriparius]|uniref:Uncharacterized protein n=1 Tax=Miscanthus lutarioriparius TaxID=422564 RepID=A0A811RCJ9_9POAL|nr:unnamed protein product [Miscanthus lutarioriparius]